MSKKIFDVQNLLWLALALALAGSLKHLAAIFASVDGNIQMGWLQAIAIDIGLFALAYSIRVRKSAKRSVKIVWLGVTMFTTISIYGNLAYGLFAITGTLPGWIMTTKPYILAGSLPVLVLFLSELLSDDRQHAKQLTTTKPPVTNLSQLPKPVTVATAGPVSELSELTKPQRKVAKLIETGEVVTVNDIVAKLNVSERTAYRYAEPFKDLMTANGKN